MLGYFYFPMCHYNKFPLLFSYFPWRRELTRFPLALCFVSVLTGKKLLEDSITSHCNNAGLGYYYIPGSQTALETGTLCETKLPLLSSKISNSSAQHYCLVLWDIRIPRTQSQKRRAAFLTVVIKNCTWATTTTKNKLSLYIYVHTRLYFVQIKQFVLYKWINNSVIQKGRSFI